MIQFIKSIADFYSNVVFCSEGYLWTIVFIIVILLCATLISFFKRNISPKEYMIYAPQYILISIICYMLENILMFVYIKDIKFIGITVIFLMLFLAFYYLTYPIQYKLDDNKKYIIQEIGMKNIFSLNHDNNNNNLMRYLLYFIIGIVIILIANLIMYYKEDDISIIITYLLIYLIFVISLIGIFSNVILSIVNKLLHKSRRCQHMFGNNLIFLFVLFVIIIPSNINFVNISPFPYGTVPQFIDAKISNKHEDYSNDLTQTSTNNISNYESQNLMINQDTIEYAYNCVFDIENLKNLKDSQLNCHESVTPYLNQEKISYDNQVIDSIISLTKNYKVNPSYLVTQILGYDKSYATQYSVATPTDKLFNIDLNLEDKSSMTSEEYAKHVFKTLMNNFSPTAKNSNELQIFLDTDVWYTYFALYTEYSIDYITFYLKLDNENNIVDVDYTMLRFINLVNLSQNETISIEDYALELDNIYYSAFSDSLVRKCNLYDTVFTTNPSESTDLTYLKRYSCTFSKY